MTAPPTRRAAGTALAATALALAVPTAAHGQASPTATSTASATASATADASPTASATTSPSPSATSGASTPTVTGRPSTCTTDTGIALTSGSTVAGRPARVTARVAPGSELELHAHSAPSSTYRLVREATADPQGRAVFDVVPPTHTQLYAQQVGCDPTETVTLRVRSSVSISALRDGRRDYRFEGRVLPAAPVPVVLYRVEDTGREVLTSRTTAGEDGIWRLRRQFLGSGRFGFLARVPATPVNDAGASAVRPTVIH